MVQFGPHVRTRWMVRGGANRRLDNAWQEGISVECPNYTYDEARLDPDTGLVMLRRTDKISTVIDTYDPVDYRIKIPVECFECGASHHSTGECPLCGSGLWRCR